MVDKLETPARAILVIEDDFAIRGLLGLTMRNAGYVVWETATGEEGIEVFRQHRDSIGLIILDLGLPGIDGLDTARGLACAQTRHWPGLYHGRVHADPVGRDVGSEPARDFQQALQLFMGSGAGEGHPGPGTALTHSRGMAMRGGLHRAGFLWAFADAASFLAVVHAPGRHDNTVAGEDLVIRCRVAQLGDLAITDGQHDPATMGCRGPGEDDVFAGAMIVDAAGGKDRIEHGFAPLEGKGHPGC